MGQKNETVLSYMEDEERFADLFNQLYFGGIQVVDAKELVEASEVYPGKPDEKGGRARDIKKRLKSGRELKILALESQSEISYIMPWRVMDYDCREYGKQIRKIQRANKEHDKAGEKVYKDAGERMSGVRREERLAPVYTICLYHGREPWDGPRSLRDMMDFGDAGAGEGDRPEWEECFADYPLHLVDACEPMDCSGFRTSLKELFTILPCHRDKERLKELMDREQVFRKLDEETARTISVLMDIMDRNKYEESKEKYMTEEGEYDLCQAIRDMMEDSRQEGIVTGEARGEARRTIGITESVMKNLRCSLERACEIAGMTLSEYQQAKALYTETQ